VEIENAAERRLLVARDIRMPVLAVDALGIGVGVDRQYLRMPRGPGLIGMNVQVAEIPAEPLVGLLVQRLIAEEQNLVLGERTVQLVAYIIDYCCDR
jgi:hypothetical protein